nr:endonuclease/exonuclease/phosphatase family protein [Streptococcus ovuberis]
MEDHQEDKIEELARVIAEKDYDVVALQEVNQSITAPYVSRELKADNYGLKVLEHLESLVGPCYSYFWSNSHIGYDRYDEGIAILTKLPVYEVDTFYCSRHRTLDSILSRKVLGVTVSYNGQLITCYSCHINLPNSPGEDQLENIAAIVKRTDQPVLKILLGDFNTDAVSDRPAYEAIKSLGLYDGFELAHVKDSGITVEKAIDGWDGNTQEKRLDYIFLNQEREVLSSQVIFNGNNKQAISDHFGIEMIINI